MPGSLAARRAGKPLAGGWRGVVVMLKGDLDWYWKVLGVPRDACGLCDANAPGRTWSAWMSVENMQPKLPTRHPLFAQPSYLTLWQVCPDLMHSKHLGVDQYVAGSVLALLTCGGMPAQFQAACDSVLEDIKAACSRHGARSLASLKPSMFLSDVKQPWAHYPRLKAKAAETKHLMPALRDVWQARAEDTEIDSNIARCLDMSCRIDSIIDACPRFALPTDKDFFWHSGVGGESGVGWAFRQARCKTLSSDALRNPRAA